MRGIRNHREAATSLTRGGLADAGRTARLQVPEAVTDMTAKYGYLTLKRVLVASDSLTFSTSLCRTGGPNVLPHEAIQLNYRRPEFHPMQRR